MKPTCQAPVRLGCWVRSCTWMHHRSIALLPYRVRVIPLIAVLSLVLGLLPYAVVAQEIKPLKVGIFGPYFVSIISNPERPVEGLGGPRFTVQVHEAADRTAVTDAAVVVSFKRPDGSAAGQVSLPQNPSLKQYYEGRLTLEQFGHWNWTVAVDSPYGLATIDGTIEVLEAPAPVGRKNFGFVGMVLGLSAIGFLAYFALRPKKGGLSPEDLFRERMAQSRGQLERELREREERRDRESK